MKKKLINFKDRFLKPFWFSHNCHFIKVPYIYGFAIMVLFITSIIIFLDMAVSKQYSSGTLAAVSSVIGVLAGLYFGTLRLYNHSLELKSRQPNSEEPPSSTSTIIDTITKRVGRPKKDPDQQEVD
jgi:hypothetical protein